jgi:hypothetical protein
MLVVGLAAAGIFAIAGHTDGPKLNLRPANQGATSNIGPWGEAGRQGQLAATRRPAERSNGTDLNGGQRAVISAGVRMPGKVSQLTGSGFLGVQSSIIPSPTGEATSGWGNPWSMALEAPACGPGLRGAIRQWLLDARRKSLAAGIPLSERVSARAHRRRTKRRNYSAIRGF